MAIANVAVAATETTLLEAAGNTALLGFILCNTAATTITVDIHCYPTGGSVVDGIIFKGIVLGASDTFSWPDSEGSIKLVLSTGGKLTATASATGVKATVSYQEF